MKDKRPILAICNDIAEFYCDKLRDIDWSSKFIGTLWITELYKISTQTDFIIASGDVALGNVKRGEWCANDILVIQELDSIWGQQLIDLGAKPLLLTCFESPLYAYNFYDKIDKIAKKFKYIMAPIGAISKAENLIKCFPLRFPSYSLKDISSNKNKVITKKSKAVLIASNKYWRYQLSSCPPPIRWTKFLSWLKVALILYVSRSRRMAERCQLHDKRYKIINLFSKNNFLSIYGDGWHDIKRYPQKWKDLAFNINWNGKVKEKKDVLSSYLFSICIENTSLAGYTTEKIIDAMVAGSIPLYLGDPFIDETIPKEAFINIASFKNEDELFKYLKGLKFDEIEKLIYEGQKFIKSEDGQKFSHESFASWIIELARQNI